MATDKFIMKRGKGKGERGIIPNIGHLCTNIIEFVYFYLFQNFYIWFRAMKPVRVLLFAAGFLASTASPLLAAAENPWFTANNLPQSQPCLLAVAAGGGYCYDNLAVSALGMGLPLLSLLALIRLRREILANRRAVAALASVTEIIEYLSREESLATLLQAIITLQEDQKTGLHVSLLLAGQKGDECIHQTGMSPFFAAFIRDTDAHTGLRDCWSCQAKPAQDRYQGCQIMNLTPWRLALQSGQPVHVATDDGNTGMSDFLNRARQIGITAVWSQPVQDNQGVILGVVSFCYQPVYRRTSRDKARMRQIQNLLKLVALHHRQTAQLHLMQALVEKNNEPMYLCSPEEDFRLCYVNEATVRHFGYDREKVLNLRVPDYDPNFTLEQLRTFWQILKTKGHHRTCTVNRLAGGREVPVEVSGFYFRHGEHEYIAGSFRDISEQRQAEQEARSATLMAETRRQQQRKAESRSDLLEALITHSTTPQYLIDPHDEFRLVYVNAAAVGHFGYPKAQLIGMNIRDINVELDKDQLDILWKTLKTNGNLTLETWHTTAGSVRIAVEVTCHYLNHEGREYIAGYCHDISRRKQYQSDLIEARRQAEQALAVRNRFLAHMSHEMLTPLNGVMGLSQLALRSDSMVVVRDYLDRIHFSANNLLIIISDVLDLAKIDDGSLRIHQAPVNIRSLLQETLNQTRPKAEAKKITLAPLIDKRIPEWIEGDPHRLSQILLNLIDNAIKFTDEGGVRVLLDMTSRDEATPVWIRFTVMDTGIGIKPEDMPRLFQPFEQLDDSIQRRYGGSGLGLVICRNLAELMGGRITVDSKPGTGSRFIVELPFERASPPLTQASQPDKLSATPLSGLNILIVEDNHINQTVARAMVEKLGATATLADNGTEALIQLHSQAADTYDVILMDIQMPVMDGLTATRHIRNEADFSDIPIIAVSAHTLDSDREASLEAGMNAHLNKPLRREELVKTILQCLTEPSRQRLYASSRDWAQLTGKNLLDLSVLETTDAPLRALFQDLPRAFHKIDGNETLYCEMAGLFLTDHARDMEKIRDFMANQRYPEARRAAQTLASLAATLGLSTLNEAATRLETALAPGQEDQRESAADPLEKQMEYAFHHLKRLIRH